MRYPVSRNKSSAERLIYEITRGRVGAKQVAAPESVCATPHKILRNLIDRLSRDPNLDSTTYTITKIKT